MVAFDREINPVNATNINTGPDQSQRQSYRHAYNRNHRVKSNGVSSLEMYMFNAHRHTLKPLFDRDREAAER
jgi:hypothetical protein